MNLRNVNDVARQWTARLQRMQIPSDLGGSLFDALVVEDVIKDIFIWLHDPSTHCLAMWVYDDDRTLTSLIGQAVAEILAKRKELSATYFFSRERVTDPASDVAYPSFVIPTIAYQLARSIPEVEAFIEHTLANDVSIFNLKVQDQIAKLVIEPLKHTSESLAQLPQRTSANVIVVHALEDCNNDDFQLAFLEEFLHGLASIEATPYSQRLLLLGRSTDHVRECFPNLPPGRLLQRPVHIQRWRTREEEIHRREEKIRKDEEDLCKKRDHVKQQQEAAQKAWKIQLQAKKIEEELRQRESIAGQREDLLLQREAAIDEKEKRLKQIEQEVKEKMAGVERRVEEVKVREGEIKQKMLHIDNKEEEFRQREEMFSQQEELDLRQEELCALSLDLGLFAEISKESPNDVEAVRLIPFSAFHDCNILEQDDGTLWIHSVPQEIVNSVSEQEKKRQEAINEVIYTERDFVRNMEYLRDVRES